MNCKKLIQTLLTMTVVFYGTMVIGNYATCRDLEMNLPPIQDVLHFNNLIIPEIYVFSTLVCVNICLTIFIIYLVKYNFNKAINLINNINLLYTIRILCIYLTAYPNSRMCDEECMPIWTTVRGDFCGDIMFSGHTSTAFILILYLVSELKNKWIIYSLYIFQAFYSMSIILSRLHYTDDVIMALLLSYGSYKLMNQESRID